MPSTPKLFTPQLIPPLPLLQPALWFIFHNDHILLHTTPMAVKIPQCMDINAWNLAISAQHYLGMYENIPCFGIEVSQPGTLPMDMSFEQLRRSYELVNDEDLFLIASRARQILAWDKNTRFCGQCGHATIPSTTERAKLCPNCNTSVFPQISPVVLALIWRDNEILLARSAHFLPGIYSILAGFVEPGETLEQTVAREVYEEVGIQIKNLQYFGSQPWPFPSNLMIGFTAEYAAGEIRIDPVEIEEAQWFSVDNLPPLPKPISLSRRMIDAFLLEVAEPRS